MNSSIGLIVNNSPRPGRPTGRAGKDAIEKLTKGLTQLRRCSMMVGKLKTEDKPPLAGAPNTHQRLTLQTGASS